MIAAPVVFVVGTAIAIRPERLYENRWTQSSPETINQLRESALLRATARIAGLLICAASAFLFTVLTSLIARACRFARIRTSFG